MSLALTPPITLLDILRCPETGQPLEMASVEIIARIERQRGSGQLDTSVPIVGGLLRRDGRLFYPIRDGIPILLASEAISLDNLPHAP